MQTLLRTKMYQGTNNIKMKNCKFQKVCTKNHTCYFDDIIDFEDFDFDILIAEKSRKNILIYNLSYKTLIGPKPLHI